MPLIDEIGPISPAQNSRSSFETFWAAARTHLRAMVRGQSAKRNWPASALLASARMSGLQPTPATASSSQSASCAKVLTAAFFPMSPSALDYDSSSAYSLKNGRILRFLQDRSRRFVMISDRLRHGLLAPTRAADRWDATALANACETREERLRILQEAALLGSSVADVARRYDVSRSQIYQ